MRRFLPIIIFVAVISLIVYLLLLTSGLNPLSLFNLNLKKEEPSKVSRPISVRGSEVIRQTSLFLDSLKKPDGQYFMEKTCENGRCKEGTTSGITTYLVEGLLATGAKEKADVNMKAFLSVCEKSDPKLDYCTSIVPSASLYYEQTKDSSYLSAMKRAQDFFFGRISSKLDTLSQRTEKTLALYKATKDEKYLKTAKTLFFSADRVAKEDKENPVVYKEKNLEVRRKDCFVPLYIYIPMYKATKDQTYLNLVKQFFANANITSQLSQFSFLTSMTPCAEALLELSSLTGDQSYKAQAKSIVSYLVETYWDGSQRKIVNADGGFIRSKQSQNKALFANAWMLKVLAPFANETFRL